jgi:hypothetical protein
MRNVARALGERILRLYYQMTHSSLLRGVCGIFFLHLAAHCAI